MHIKEEAAERHTLSIVVDNEAGILARIAGMFTARGYNISSLTVADITEDHKVSRITIVTYGPPEVIDQIIAQPMIAAQIHVAAAPAPGLAIQRLVDRTYRFHGQRG